MTREEAKYFWPIIKAYSEGKTVQYLLSEGRWVDVTEDFLFDNSHERYRVKQEPKYRPFRDNNECWDELHKHQPFGWLIGKVSGLPTFIPFVLYDSLFIHDTKLTYEEAMGQYTFTDGAPFGVEY